jgi:hypothetical protein
MKARLRFYAPLLSFLVLLGQPSSRAILAQGDEPVALIGAVTSPRKAR